MSQEAPRPRRPHELAAGVAARAGRSTSRALTTALGGAERTRVIVLLASVLALASADAATVGAAAIQLRADLEISNTDIGLLVTVTSLVAAAASLPFGVLADRMRRIPMLAGAIVLWGGAMLWTATVPSFGKLLLARLFLGGVTAAAGPIVASLVGDWFKPSERGRIYGYIISGELIGAAIGFAVTGGVATVSWRAAFVILALPAFVLAWLVFHLREPARGGRTPLLADGDTPPDGAELDEDLQVTDAQHLARERGIEPDPDLVLRRDPRKMNLIAATRYVLSIKTNVALIIASACGYYFLAGVQTFGVEFVTKQYGIAQVLSTLVLVAVGAAGVVGVIAGGSIGDALLHRGYLNGRILVSAVSATLAVILFVPAVLTRSPLTALPYIAFAVMALAAQNPPLDAARLDIVPGLLWGRAEGVRTFLRTLAQAFAPLFFGIVSDHVFGGGRSGLQWTFVLMLLPLAASAYFLFRALRTYPRDVATTTAAVPAEPLL
ncbi:MAG TPA: MFS transporter [Gaiellaceae bacterium]|nr:MFS transporter [Gaiellaceae bacterium]